MRIAYFTQSLLSCWNHGNAHFLRGVLRELGRLGHEVTAFEPASSWSLANLLTDHGEPGLAAFRKAYPDLRCERLPAGTDLRARLDGMDLVIVHEWNESGLVSAIGALRRRLGFTLLFHDTHHRAVSDPQSLAAFDLSQYDGVLAFGDTLAAVYRARGFRDRCFVWHEAADTTLFRPPATPSRREGLVFIGNWGDDERNEELTTFLFAPAAAAGLPLTLHGVRYPPDALAFLARLGFRYEGWLPNARVPEVFARHLATVHVPRRYYAQVLPGIPTIRVFEALACGIPLLSAPWQDSEGLFRAGTDYLPVRDGEEMRLRMIELRDDAGLRGRLAARGLETILARHTCAHRARELLRIVARLQPRTTEPAIA